MWRNQKRKEHSGNCEGSTGCFLDYFGLEGLNSFHIGEYGRPPYFLINKIILPNDKK
jgi:hypothetical protein